MGSLLIERSALARLAWLFLVSCQQRQESVGRPPPIGSASAPVPSRTEPAPGAPIGGDAAEAEASGNHGAGTASVNAAASDRSSDCREQTAQSFLVDAHFDSFHAAGGSADDWQRLLRKAVRYRTEQYGYFKGYGEEAWNIRTPAEQAQVVRFFGVPVPIHRRIAPALACVEKAIRARCVDHPYQPYVLSGLRKRNTYLNGEISNHVYGIALDVDPARNPCCGCVGAWRASERCQNGKTKLQRMEMPACWVTEFERFGFYWLGHSKLEDTMHFEFLADPARIIRDDAATK